MPAAHSTRPQLGSLPLTPHFTNGEFAIERAIVLAASSLTAPRTMISTNFRGAFTIAGNLVGEALTDLNGSALENVAISFGLAIFTPLAPDASTQQVSLVEAWSSTVTLLN